MNVFKRSHELASGVSVLELREKRVVNKCYVEREKKSVQVPSFLNYFCMRMGNLYFLGAWVRNWGSFQHRILRHYDQGRSATRRPGEELRTMGDACDTSTRGRTTNHGGRLRHVDQGRTTTLRPLEGLRHFDPWNDIWNESLVATVTIAPPALGRGTVRSDICHRYHVKRCYLNHGRAVRRLIRLNLAGLAHGERVTGHPGGSK